jgi:hypothetical protein
MKYIIIDNWRSRWSNTFENIKELVFADLYPRITTKKLTFKTIIDLLGLEHYNFSFV